LPYNTLFTSGVGDLAKQETVEITIRVPKSLLACVEAEGYFNFKREYFFEAAIRGMIGSSIGNLSSKDTEKFYEKYGRNIDEYFVTEEDS